MPRLLPLLFCLWTGCADLEHSLVRLEGGEVAYRLIVSPHDGWASDLQGALTAVPETAGAVVRGWIETDARTHRLVVQGRFDTLNHYQAWVDAGLLGAAARWGSVPAAWRPPMPRASGDTWQLDMAVRDGPGTYTLAVRAPGVSPAGMARDPDGTHRWTVGRGQALDVSLTLSSARKASIAESFRSGGPPLLFALAGLGVLVWVIRRQRRQRLRAERPGARGWLRHQNPNR